MLRVEGYGVGVRVTVIFIISCKKKKDNFENKI